jgi:hypothetical protein
MSAHVIWRPEAFTARLVAAAIPARQEWAAAAGAACASSRVGSSMHVVNDLVEAEHPLAPIIEFGSKPHEIGPNAKSALKFGSVFASVVEHPGTRARPFMRPALPLWPAFYKRTAAGMLRGL